MRAKNKKSSFEAQCSFEDFLKKKHGTEFGKLTIESCTEENSLNSMFGDIFGTDNPFKF